MRWMCPKIVHVCDFSIALDRSWIAEKMLHAKMFLKVCVANPFGSQRFTNPHGAELAGMFAAVFYFGIWGVIVIVVVVVQSSQNVNKVSISRPKGLRRGFPSK